MLSPPRFAPEVLAIWKRFVVERFEKAGNNYQALPDDFPNTVIVGTANGLATFKVDNEDDAIALSLMFACSTEIGRKVVAKVFGGSIPHPIQLH